ncbi:unnamed protein product, partial [Rangifer tarandus platyrhynchus]
LSEDKVKEVSNSTLEEEALPASVACEADNEHGIQEDLIDELHQAWAEEQSLKTLKEFGDASEHGFTEDLPVNPACDKTEETPLSSLLYLQVALSECES